MPTLADLFRMGRQYVADALPGGSLNPEVTRQGVLDAAAVSTIPVPVLGDLVGLGADVHRYVNEPESRTPGNFALTGLGMLPFVPAMTAWHGSPHKFDKFSLDKIGTGEGAQAYGHGLYLAENPSVAKDYAGALSAARSNKPVGNVDLQQVYQSLPNDVPDTLLAARRDFRALNESGELSAADRRDFLDAVKRNITASRGGNLYKTDIPDEAVARFLDWDKPLSQQAPEVQAALSTVGVKVGTPKVENRSGRWAVRDAEGVLHGPYFLNKADAEARLGSYDRSGQSIVKQLADEAIKRGHVGDNGAYVPLPNNFNEYSAASDALKQAGIPGIRYLDGGSRSAGNGTSNFVVFDPEMIRILERNGQPTGLQPWKPGEYKLRDLITN